MADFSINIFLPGGEVPDGSDPEALISRIIDEMSAIAKVIPSAEEPTIDRKPPPENTTGISELIQIVTAFYLENQQGINDTLIAIGGFLRAISTSINVFLKWKQQKKKNQDPVEVIIDGQKITLPATSDSIDDYIKALKKRFTSTKG